MTKNFPLARQLHWHAFVFFMCALLLLAGLSFVYPPRQVVQQSRVNWVRDEGEQLHGASCLISLIVAIRLISPLLSSSYISSTSISSSRFLHPPAVSDNSLRSLLPAVNLLFCLYPTPPPPPLETFCFLSTSSPAAYGFMPLSWIVFSFSITIFKAIWLCFLHWTSRKNPPSPILPSGLLLFARLSPPLPSETSFITSVGPIKDCWMCHQPNDN